jgi:alpha-tubulin suppressor-like RCC1 family protein
MNSRFQPYVLVLIATGLASACDLNASGPGGEYRIAVEPLFESMRAVHAVAIAIDSVRVDVRRGEEIVATAAIAVDPDSSEITIELTVPINEIGETLGVDMQVTSDDGSILFEGSTEVETGATGSAAAPVPLAYVGPGADVATITLLPADSLLTVDGTLQFDITALDATGAPVTVYVSWDVAPDAAGEVNADGLMRAATQRVAATVTATAPNGVVGSASLSVVPMPSVLQLASGDGQQGSVGVPLPQPLTVRVVATDGLGVPGITVQFAPVAGGSVAPASAVTDNAGYASTTATLGANPGTYTFQASVSGLSPVTFTANISAVPLSFVQIEAGGAHTCGIAIDGLTYCWGRGTSGQLGSTPIDQCDDGEGGFYACALTPHAVDGSLAFAGIVLGDDYSCGWTFAGAGYCWGSNAYAQLGTGDMVDHPAPTPVTGGLVFISMSVPLFGDTPCGLSSGVIHCWGQGGLPLGFTGPETCSFTNCSTAPVVVPRQGGPYTATASGSGFNCGLDVIGSVDCWGGNGLGTLGNGTTVSDSVPSVVVGGMTYQSLDAGYQHICGLSSTGAAYCWGQNASGQNGQAPSAQCGFRSCDLTPVAVSGQLTFLQITSGGQHTCGLDSSGTAWCWGGSGYLGGATGTDTCEFGACSITPLAVAGLTFQSISAGGNHTCGLTTSGAAYCWGLNSSGQLGNNSQSGSSTPIAVAPAR